MGRSSVKEYSEATGASDTEATPGGRKSLARRPSRGAAPRGRSFERACMLYGGARRRNWR